MRSAWRKTNSRSWLMQMTALPAARGARRCCRVASTFEPPKPCGARIGMQISRARRLDLEASSAEVVSAAWAWCWRRKWDQCGACWMASPV